MTHPIAERDADQVSSAAAHAADSKSNRASHLGPDPSVGAGITLFGIFLMGTGGASDAHYLFDVGVATSVIGAVMFVLFVGLSALKQRTVTEHGPQD